LERPNRTTMLCTGAKIFTAKLFDKLKAPIGNR
jgi:hypothetical protein